MFKRAPKPGAKRTRPVAVTGIRCPECGAEVAKACRNAKGDPVGTVHVARKRMATRKENQG